MQPTYSPGDLALVYFGENLQIKSGDVVLFSAGGEAVLHRVIQIEGGLITTQGDANPNPDNPKLTRVDGKLLFAIPKVGYLVDFIQIPFRWVGSLLAAS